MNCWHRPWPALLAVGLLVATGCQVAGGRSQGKVVVVFMDVSASVRDYGVYYDSWRVILEHLHEGDRIVLGKITDQTYTAFRPVLDHELPRFNPFTENSKKFERLLRDLHHADSLAIDSVLSAPRSPRTDILNTLDLAGKVFAGDPRRPILVLLSDMLEDSEHYNFEREPVTTSLARRVIEARREAGELPDLRGAHIYVAGASSRNAEIAHEVQHFWIEYAKAAGGRLEPQDYGPALLNFAE